MAERSAGSQFLDEIIWSFRFWLPVKISISFYINRRDILARGGTRKYRLNKEYVNKFCNNQDIRIKIILVYNYTIVKFCEISICKFNFYSYFYAKEVLIVVNTESILATNLKRVRIKKGWSQAYVTRQLGISIRTLSKAETGKGISNKNLDKLCMFYGINSKSLFDSELIRKSSKPRNVLSEEEILRIIRNNSFVEDIEQVAIHKYTDRLLRELRLDRVEIEDIINSVTDKEANFKLSDVIWCCMAVNMKTLESISKLSLETANQIVE
ncbi:helix-turn-helix domain-containing protein [Pseudobutyrivibrio ruminis]|uniref:helix-turn-helix domain-containing protein n=1 Tax=Pseudobutyrivibrio ruminis TaxID=46206 RepID=UPI001A97D42D|nr:helix-turn-helix domain-containing protein [Pseudobutyrivibrio ruminis]